MVSTVMIVRGEVPKAVRADGIPGGTHGCEGHCSVVAIGVEVVGEADSVRAYRGGQISQVWSEHILKRRMIEQAGKQHRVERVALLEARDRPRGRHDARNA